MPRGLKFDRKDLVPDLLAGATFAVVNVPQGMANALLASVNPVAGLYALMIAMPVGAVFTGSVFMNVSTTGALSVAAGEALQYYDADDRMRALACLVLLVGAIQIGFGYLGLGRLIRFVSHAVMTGFISGIAVLIVLGSIGDLTGFYSDETSPLLELADTAQHWRRIDGPTFFVGLAMIALIFLVQATRLRKYALIVALAGATLLALMMERAFGAGSIALVREVAEIPRSLPRPVLPSITLIPELLLPALGIAIVGLVQGAGVGQSYPNPGGQFPDVSRDFIGQGAANLAGGGFGAIPAGGSMSGTAVTVQAGARSRWANIFGGGFVVLIVFLFVGLVGMIPMAGLGGLLFVVGLQSIPPETIRAIWTTGLMSRLAMVATFAAALFLPLQYAILFGVMLSFLLQITRMADRVELREIELVEGGFPIDRAAPEAIGPDEIHILRVKGSLFFASAQAVEDRLPDISLAERSVVVLTLRDVPDLGSTVIRLLKRYAAKLQQKGGVLMLAGVDGELFRQLERTGVVELLGTQNIFWERPQLGASLNEAIIAARRRRARAEASGSR